MLLAIAISFQGKFLQFQLSPLLYPGQAHIAGSTKYRRERITMTFSILQACMNADEDAKGSKENSYAVGQNKVLGIVCEGILCETNLDFSRDCADIPKREERSDLASNLCR